MITEKHWHVVYSNRIGVMNVHRNMTLSDAVRLHTTYYRSNLSSHILGPEGWDGCYYGMKHNYGRLIPEYYNIENVRYSVYVQRCLDCGDRLMGFNTHPCKTLVPSNISSRALETV
jgi:hypothetical protein